MRKLFLTLAAAIFGAFWAMPSNGISPAEHMASLDTTVVPSLAPDTSYTRFFKRHNAKVPPVSIYALPYTMTGPRATEDWHRMWVNTAVIAGAYVGTLFVLECLPENATSWNRASLQKDSPGKRWFNNVFKRGPEWDHDNPVFNYVLHPYAGAVYFMSARSCGFNFYRSMLYCAIVSTVGWEYGIEACMERPSIQDIFITPIVGSAIGECFYRFKRHIVANDYRLLGSAFLGNFAAFLIDPVNEVVDLFRGSRTRHLQSHGQPGAISSLLPTIAPGRIGISFCCIF